MDSHQTRLKKQELISWITMLRKKQSRVEIGNYSYKCLFSGAEISKTLIVFPDELVTKGIITIDKPLDEVEFADVMRLSKKLFRS